MKLWSNSFQDGAVIPSQFAFCKIDRATHAAMSDNKNPHLQWSDLPAGTRSLVLICHDYDVPSKGDDVNQEGKNRSCQSAPRGFLSLGDDRSARFNEFHFRRRIFQRHYRPWKKRPGHTS